MVDIRKIVEEQVKRKQKEEALHQCFSAEDLRSRPTEKQWSFFNSINTPSIKYRYINGGNQGSKTSQGVRELTWLIQDVHPSFERPNKHHCHICKNKDIEVKGQAGAETYFCSCGNIWKDWGDIPFGCIVMGESRTNIEENLWPRIRALLINGDDKSVWKPKQTGGHLQSVENLETGAKIIFLPHGYSEEEARKATQGFTLMFVWVDELPALTVMEELQRRVDARLAYFLGTFTPKKVDPKVRRFIQGQLKSGIALQFIFEKYDNPQFAHIKEFEKKKLVGLSKARRQTIEEGAWPEDEAQVYSWDYDTMTVPSLPEGYHKGWSHMEIVDPAMVNKMGYMLCTLDERTGIWYTVRAEYIHGEAAPSELVRIVDSMSQGYNIQWWASDTEQFFIREAQLQFPHKKYKTPYKKTSRKKDLIKNLQQALSEGSFKVLQDHVDLIDEIEECKYNDSGEKIIAATKYHLLDCAQYHVDIRPKVVVFEEEKSMYQIKKEATLKYRKKKEQQHKYIKLKGKRNSLFKRRGRKR